MAIQSKPKDISVFLDEKRNFKPSEAFRKQANMNDPKIYERAVKDPEAFWAGFAEELSWFKKWDRVLEWNPPQAKWFVGGKLNVSYNCVDRWAKSEQKNKTAIIWEGEPGDVKTLTFEELYKEVCRFANALKSVGVKKGDRVAIYLPMIPEAAISMLACTRIGAVHSVVFGGFSAESLGDRINDAQATAVITADGGWRRGSVVPLKKATDEAITDAPSVKSVIVVNRCDTKPEMKKGRDYWWHELREKASEECEPEQMDSEDLLYILYTSGTTGKPKGIMHTTGGYLTGAYATTKWVFDLKPNDIYWCTADVGWVTGHSYIVYGPLANAATIVMYEGAPNHPGKDRFWELVAKHKVSIFYTAPTAIRAFMKWGPDLPKKHDLSSLRLLGTVGEPINPEAWIWYHENIGREKCPIVDTWWQTETGSILITPLPGIVTTKPGSATKPFPGIEVKVLNEAGEESKTGGGYLAITKPWPSMLRGIYGDPERYKQTYWSKWKNTYFPGDGARKDEEGYFWLLGRVDDVLNVSGHRIGTMEVESALVDHPKVAESAVVGKTHEIKGEAIVAFVTIKEGIEGTEELKKELSEFIAKKIGKFARPEAIIFSAELPKTRSGKIMRRLLKDIALGKVLGDTTTLADPSVVENLKEQYESKEG